MTVWHVMWREIRLGIRNPWAYSFLALFSLFCLALMAVQAEYSFGGYTHSTGNLINLVLYLLPLMTLLLGAFAVTSEKEDGGWQLLSTYPLTTLQLLSGKYYGLLVVLSVIVCFGFGLSGLFAALFQQSLSLSMLLYFVMFSMIIVIIFAAIAVLIGTISRNRWQALTICVGVWFLFIIGWSTALISVLSKLPYLWIKPTIVTLTFLNPAELIRIFMVSQMGGGSIFGPEYAQWIRWIDGPWGLPLFLGVCALWVLLTLGLAMWLWERGRRRG